MKWERVRPYVLSGAAAVILGQFLVLVDYYYRLKMSYAEANA